MRVELLQIPDFSFTKYSIGDVIETADDQTARSLITRGKAKDIALNDTRESVGSVWHSYPPRDTLSTGADGSQ